MKVATKRQQRNVKINYSRLIVTVEGILSDKQAELQGGGEYYEKLRIAEDIKFWKKRLEDLRAKAVNGA